MTLGLDPGGSCSMKNQERDNYSTSIHRAQGRVLIDSLGPPYPRKPPSDQTLIMSALCQQATWRTERRASRRESRACLFDRRVRLDTPRQRRSPDVLNACNDVTRERSDVKV